MDTIYTPKQDYKVLCLCYTYNQSKYIEDTLNGFAMQKTNFPFACLVIDDCSPDGEQEVIKAWLERECYMSNAEYIELEASNVILATHKTNSNCTFAIYLLKRNLCGQPLKQEMIAPWRDHAEYEAMCEGDDYWIAEDKLQKQVEFMDVNLDYAMCFHSAKILFERPGAPDIYCTDIQDREYSATELFERWIVPTASIMIRQKVNQMEITDRENILNGDILIVEMAAHQGKVWGMKEQMSVYRIQNSGVTYNADSAKRRMMQYPLHYNCLSMNFPKIDRHIINIKISNSYFYRAKLQKGIGIKLKDVFRSVKYGGLTFIRCRLKGLFGKLYEKL